MARQIWPLVSYSWDVNILFRQLYEIVFEWQMFSNGHSSSCYCECCVVGAFSTHNHLEIQVGQDCNKWKNWN